VKFKNNLI